MLKELANEIIETLNESKAKDIRITELENENTELKEVNAQIAELQTQVQNLTETINTKNEENRSLNGQITTLQSEKEKLQEDLEIVNNSISQLNLEVSSLNNTIIDYDIDYDKDIITVKYAKNYKREKSSRTRKRYPHRIWLAKR